MHLIIYTFVCPHQIWFSVINDRIELPPKKVSLTIYNINIGWNHVLQLSSAESQALEFQIKVQVIIKKLISYLYYPLDIFLPQGD